MISFIVKILIQEVLEAIATAVSNYFKLRKKKKEDRGAVDEIIKIKDPKESAARMRDLLS